MSIFSTYIENNLSVFIIPKGEKRASITGWQRYCSDLATLKRAEGWDRIRKSQGANIAIALGKASRLIGLDIDTDNPATLKACPPSPVVKRGKKGETRFFKWDPTIDTLKARREELGIEILSHGTYTVIPPSIHPETQKPYEWTGFQELLECDTDDLPELDLSFLDELPKLNLITGGRNDKLKSIATAALKNGKTESQTATLLLNYDKKNHQSPLFSDRSEYVGEPKDNATKMVKSIAKSVLPAEETIVTAIPEPKPQKLRPLPTPTGLLAFTQDKCLQTALHHNQDAALASAIGLLSAFCLGRYKFANNLTNIWIMVIGATSAGKNAGLQFIPKVLNQTGLEPFDLMGQTKIGSREAFYEPFPNQRFRIDTANEIQGDLFKSKVSPNHKQYFDAIGDFWDRRTGYFKGVRAITRGEKTFECESPLFSYYATTQPETIAEAMDRGMIESGLIPRFIPVYIGEKEFINHDALDFDETKDLDDLTRILVKEFKTPVALKPLKDDFSHVSIDHKRLGPRPINIDPERRVIGLRNEVVDYFDQLVCAQPDPILAALGGKLGENAFRITPIVYKSLFFRDSFETGDKPKLIQAIDWSREFMEVCFENSKLMLAQGAVSGKIEQAIQTVEIMFQRIGYKPIYRSRLARRVPNTFILDKAIDSLIAQEKIGNLTKKAYHWVRK